LGWIGERGRSEWENKESYCVAREFWEIAIQRGNQSGGKEGSFGKQERIHLELLKLKHQVRGAIYIFLVYVVWLLVLLCYRNLKDVQVWDFLVIVDAKVDKKKL